MLKYKCWLVPHKKKSMDTFESDSSKEAAKKFINKNWYKNISVPENPWDNMYAVSVEDFKGCITTWTVTVKPSFCASSFIKKR